MAKSKRRSKSQPEKSIAWVGTAASGTKTVNLILGVMTIAILLGGAIYWWQGRSAKSGFLDLAVSGQPALAGVETFPNDGRKHLKPGEHYSYASSTPTSGPHDPFPTDPGVYETPQPPTKLVHALEHGLIVFYYDRPGPEVMEQLREWAALYSGTWDGIVVTPLPGLGEMVVATAWQKKLNLSPFDAAAAAAFADAYRGRGPENPVR